MRGIRLDNGGTYFVAQAANSTTWVGLVHVDRPMGLARASSTADIGAPTLSGYTITLEIARGGTHTGIVAATLLNADPLAFQPLAFALPTPKGGYVMLQAQDLLELQVAQSGSSVGNLPNGYLRLDLFARR